MALSDLPGRFEAAGDAMGRAAAALRLLDPGARAFGADAPGRLGELGRHLHTRWAATMIERGEEASAQADRFAAIAAAIRGAVTGYRETERAIRDQPAIREA